MVGNLNEQSGLIEEMLKLSKVKEGERVLVVTTHEYDREDLRDYRIALDRLGTQSVHLVLPPRAKGPRLTQPGTALFYDLMQQADFILFAYSSCAGEKPLLPSTHHKVVIEYLQQGKGRALHVQSPLKKVREMWPSDALFSRTLTGAKIMEEAEMIRIVSDSGTDLIMNKKGRPAHTQYGVADVPGRWDNFAFGCVSSTPHEDSANGTLVLEPPGAISPLVRFIHDKAKLTIKNGYITNIEGGLEAKLLETWFAQQDDPESYGTSHVGWGTHKRAGVGSGGGWLNLVSYFHNAYGTLLIAFGDSYHPSTSKYSGGGGERIASSHCDIGGLEVDFYLDDRLICSKGQIVDPECK
jgi:2,5-dihydroxypyridine 5,6-dioxygenase